MSACRSLNDFEVEDEIGSGCNGMVCVLSVNSPMRIYGIYTSSFPACFTDTEVQVFRVRCVGCGHPNTATRYAVKVTFLPIPPFRSDLFELTMHTR